MQIGFREPARMSTITLFPSLSEAATAAVLAEAGEAYFDLKNIGVPEEDTLY
jgi:hypothetical protein